MKKITHALLITAVVVVTMVSMVFLIGLLTATSTSTQKDLARLNAEIAMLNSDASLPQGDRIIAKQLMDTFRVDSDRVSSLIGGIAPIGSSKQRYGDAAAMLAFASEMPGGATEDNIAMVSNMRQKSEDWGQLAQNLGVDVGKVVNKLTTFENYAHKKIKQAYVNAFYGSAAGGMSE